MTATVHKQHVLSLAAGTFLLECSGDPSGLSYAAGSLATQRDATAPHSGLWLSYGGGTWKMLSAWLDDLADVATAGAAAGNALVYSGSVWGPAAVGAAGSVTAVSGTGGVAATTSGTTVALALDPAFLLAST